MPDFPVNQIICGDAIEVLRTLPDQSIDLVLTDPPYGIGEAAGKNKSRGNRHFPGTDFGNLTWDNKRIPDEYIHEIIRISKNQVIFGGNYYADILPASSCWIIWDKQINGDFADCELAWTSFRSAVRKFTWRWNGMLQQDMKNKEIRVHPTQKPVALGAWIIKKYSKLEDTILDPFCGSGSFLIAAHNLGRKYLGIDLNPDYVRMAEERLAPHLAQRRF